MSYKLYPTEEFKKHAKIIKDIYPDFKNDLFELSKELKKDPLSVPGLDPLGDGLYKCRVDITGKPAGKSYGARVIYLVITADGEVWVMTCFDKSNKKDLSGAELAALRKKAKAAQKAKPGSDRDTLLESIHLKRKAKKGK
jgi:hypothetical protein